MENQNFFDHVNTILMEDSDNSIEHLQSYSKLTILRKDIQG